MGFADGAPRHGSQPWGPYAARTESPVPEGTLASG